MNVIAIGNTPIRQDSSGRYCLNDLHKASGEEARHKPGNWLMLDQTKALAGIIEIAGITAIKSKQGLGTYVVKELVYAYAMWISPEFNLRVIRAFDAMVAGHTQQPVHKPDRAISTASREFRGALQIAKAVGLTGNQAVLSANQAVQKVLGISPLGLIGHEKLVEPTQVPCFPPRDLGLRLGISAQAFNRRLTEAGMQLEMRDGNDRIHRTPTAKGQAHAVLVDTSKKDGNGRMIQQLLW